MKYPAPLATLFLVVAAALSACQKTPPASTATADEARIKSIGQNYLDANAPQWKAEYSLPSILIDHPDTWEYTFQLPKGTIGGTPAVFIDKRTPQVTKVVHYQ